MRRNSKVVILSIIFITLFISLFNVVSVKADEKTEWPDKIVLTIGSDIMVVDGKEVTLNVAPEITNGRTFVPFRSVISVFPNVSIVWISETNCVSVIFDNQSINMQVGNTAVVIGDGKVVYLDVAPYIKNNYLMIPVRFVVEIMGCNV